MVLHTLVYILHSLTTKHMSQTMATLHFTPVSRSSTYAYNGVV